MTRPLSITVIGPGRVGQTLLRLGHSSGVFELADILARRPDAAAAARDFAGGGRAITGFEDLRPADLFLLTVPDDQLAGVAGDLARQGLPPAVAAHCSGFHPAALLAPGRRADPPRIADYAFEPVSLAAGSETRAPEDDAAWIERLRGLGYLDEGGDAPDPADPERGLSR